MISYKYINEIAGIKAVTLAHINIYTRHATCRRTPVLFSIRRFLTTLLPIIFLRLIRR